MQPGSNVLIMGASYGSLLATKLLLAGHSAKLICLPVEAALISAEGTRVRMPVRGRDTLVEVDPRELPGRLSAGGPSGVDPSAFDIVARAMQEPRYRSAGVRELLDEVGKARFPCVSIMKIPPLPYLEHIPGVSAEGCRSCCKDASVWDSFEAAKMTLCSPDAQAFRPPEEKVRVLQVSLPTNFKAARFEPDADTAILRNIAADIEAARFDTGVGRIELPVKLKVHDSVFVPLAKWAMLLAGNDRCVQQEGMRSICDAIHADPAESRATYDWVNALCVPFEKYANAARSLAKRSSAARALAAGATHIDRTERLVQAIAAQHGMRSAAVDATVATIDGWLERNRKKAA